MSSDAADKSSVIISSNVNETGLLHRPATLEKQESNLRMMLLDVSSLN